MKKLLLAFCLLFLMQKSLAQLQATAGSTPPFTVENLITNVFLGAGVEVKSITFKGDPDAIGYFNNATAAIGIKRGLLLTTGRVENSGGIVGTPDVGADFASNTTTSNSTDADLADQTTNPIEDVQVYEIEFVPIADTLRFRYVFASEEYPEYPCTPFNDVFGFFISGPKPGGGNYVAENIARVPGTGEAVTITNVRPANPGAAPCPPKNAQFYNSNNNSNKQPVYDGFLDIFTAQAIVIPCSTYKIKLAIADAGDSAYDSAVFLEAKSFGTGTLKVEFAALSLDGTITEGCSDGELTFSLPFAPTDTFKIDYTIFGTAQNGTDYAAIPMDLAILPGDTAIRISIHALEDNLPEGSEFLAFDVQRDICNRDTFQIYLRDNGLVSPLLPTDTFACAGDPILLDATLPIPTPVAPTFSNLNDLTVTPLNTPVFSPINVFGVQPFFLGDGVIREVCLKAKHVWIDDIDAFLIAPDGRFMELTTDNGRNSNNLDLCFRPVSARPVQSINDTIYALFPPNGDVPGTDMTTYFQGEFAPEGEWQDLWDGGTKTNGTWRLQLRDDQQGFVGTLDEWQITFEPAYKINYEWSPAGPDISCTDCPKTTITPTVSTLYKVTATDSYGCVVEDSVFVKGFDALAAPVVFCAAHVAGEVNFEWQSVVGATAYEISLDGLVWQSPSSGAAGLTHTVTGLALDQSVTLQVRAKGACPTAVTVHECKNCAAPATAFSAQPTSCFDGSDGSVQLSASGPNAPFSFELNGQNSPNGFFTGLSAGNYVAIVSDALGCAANQVFEILEPEKLNATIQILQNAGCAGEQKGTAEALPTGGTAPFSFLWSAASQSSKSASNLAAGPVSVTVTDGKGCTATASANLTEVAPIVLAMTASPATCNGKSDGSATVSASGGTGNFGYGWNDVLGQQTVSAINLPAGTFEVTVSDASGCSETSQILVDQPPVLTATFQVDSASCAGKADGSATVLPSGGTPLFTFNWAGLPTQTTATASNLLPKNYDVTVTDANGCTLALAFLVPGPLGISPNLIAMPTSCAGGSDGTAAATATGGAGNFSFNWSNGQIGPSASGLAAGAVSVTATDANGCTAAVSTQVFSPAAVVAVPTILDVSCAGKADGSIDLAASGGQPPFSFLWSDGQATKKAESLAAGIFSATVTDFNGCTTVVSGLKINEPLPISLVLTAADVACFAGKTGAIATQNSGGTAPFSFNWAGPGGFSSQNQNPTGLAGGLFSLTATDFRGCSATAMATVSQPTAAISTDLLPTEDAICFGETAGRIDFEPSGGTPPFSFLWSSGATTKTVENLPPGDYFLTVTDAAGCRFLDTTRISETPKITAQIAIDAPLCAAGTDGEATVEKIFYGSNSAPFGLFSLVWSTNPPQNGAKAFSLKAGETYFLTITDADGCSAIEQISIQNPAAFFAEIETVENAKCFGEASGKATAKGAGGTAPFNFLWSQNAGGQASATAQNLPAGTFFCTLTDANGCKATTSATVGQPPKLEASFQKTDVKCFGEPTGRAVAVASGGTSPFSFEWSNGPKTAAFESLFSAFYTFTATDANGCRASATVEIRQPEKPLEVDAFSLAPSCAGGSDGRIEIAADGGTAPYLYGLDGGAFNGSPVQIGLDAGIFEPKVRDFNGCEAKAPATEVKSRGPLTLNLGPDQTILLGQSAQLNLTITGATPPVEIIWSAEDSLWLSCMDCRNPTVDSLFYQNTFEVLVIDSAGCSASALVTIFVDKPRRVFVPTAFSPNGDSENDLLLIHGQEKVQIVNFKIFDRWGERVFEARDFPINSPTVGWDGTFRGQPCEPNLFIWTLEVEYQDFVRESFKGQTLLLR